jgi:hypothetical protein
MEQLDRLFIDTSIGIARLVHPPKIRKAIETRAAQYRRCSSVIVRLEFRRRLLRDAHYLYMRLLNSGDFEEVNEQIKRLGSNPFHKRRASICFSLLAQATGETQQDKVDRLVTRLRTLLLCGLDDFDTWLDEIRHESGCWCGTQEVRETTKGKKTVIDLGEFECDNSPSGCCQIQQFLAKMQQEIARISTYLATVPAEEKSDEIKKAEQFITAAQNSLRDIQKEQPCTVAGDLLIALESAAAKISTMYTMNGKESQHYCKALQQELIVRPAKPEEEDVICPADQSTTWKKF